MYWTKPGHEFDKTFDKILNKNTKYRLWGAAELGNKFVEKFQEQFQIVQIVDKDTNKQGTKIGNVLVQAPEELVYDCYSIVIVTCSYYDENRPAIEDKGYKPFVDLFYYEDFYIIYELYQNQHLKSKRIDISLTEKCTLRCEKCNMFMPYFKNPRNQLLKEILMDIDAYFSVVDEVKVLNLLGGEPFLYPQIKQVLDYIGNKYRHRMENMIIFTNATIVPTDEICESMRKYRVQVQISDYTGVVSYQDRLREFYKKLDYYEISHYTYQIDTWSDFGFPENSNVLEEDKLTDFFDRCKAPFRGLWNQRVYFCHLETSAIRAGLFEDNDNDYFSLSGNHGSDVKKIFMEFDYGYNHGGFLSFCRKCRGCDCVNELTVPVAIQASGEMI